MEKKVGTLVFTTQSHIDVYDYGNYFRFFLPPTEGVTGDKWIVRLEKKGFHLSDSTKSILRSSNFKPTNGVTIEVAVLKGVSFEDNQRVTKNIRKVAGNRAWKTPNAEIACLIREKFTNEEIEKMDLIWIVAMHEPIKVSRGGQDLLGADHYGGGRSLNAYYGDPDDKWRSEVGFAFTISKKFDHNMKRGSFLDW